MKSNRLFAVGLTTLLFLGLSFSGVSASSAEQKCPKVGTLSGTKQSPLVCTKIGKKLVWKAVTTTTTIPARVTTTTAATTTTTAATTTTLGLSCSMGGKCVVGDVGPGGGIVFFVATSNFTSIGSDCGSVCSYLEAAPTNWSGATGDPLHMWAFYGNWKVQVLGADGTAIGTGYQNSVDIIGQPGNYSRPGSESCCAAEVARAYRGGGKTDWYLPSRDELLELCKYARTQTTGSTSTVCGKDGQLRAGFSNFNDGSYWSSSENVTDSGNACFRTFLGTGGHCNAGKKYPLLVRPVRTF